MLRYLEFKLNEEQAKELFSIMVINYEISTLNSLKSQDINNFNKITEKGDKKEYYKEFIPFVSAVYQAPRIITQNKLLQKAFLTYKSMDYYTV